MTNVTNYNQSQRAWAKQYDVSAMAISRWRRAFQKQLGIEAPLGEPFEMADLWPRVFKQRPHPSIIAKLGKFGRPSKVVEAMKASKTPAATAPAPLLPTDPEAADFNYNDSVLIAERNLQACARILDIAIATGDPEEIRSAQPSFNAAAETLRKTKLASAKISKDDGDSFDAATVRNEIYRLHAAIPKALRSRLKDDLSAFIRSNVTPSVDQIRTAVDAAIDSAFAHLANSAFLGE